MPVYQISKWKDVFEKAESRKLKHLTWVSMPTGFRSNGFHMLLDEFGDDAPAIYGAWCALVSYAAACTVRGILCTSKGKPEGIGKIARTTGFAAELFERLFEWAVRDDVEWMEILSDDEVTLALGESADFPRENTSSGECSANPPASQENPPTTRPNQTQPNRTKHNPTSPNQTQPVLAADGRWLGADEKFWGLVCDAGGRLSKASPKLDPELVWRSCWVACHFKSPCIDDAIEKLRRREVNRPPAYINAIMRGLCDDNGWKWTDLQQMIPAPVLKSPSKAKELDHAAS